MTTSIYQTCYDLVTTYLFGSVAVGSYHELVCIAVSVMATLFVFAIPFIVVYRIIKLFCGG